jgi:hypothetical protein
MSPIRNHRCPETIRNYRSPAGMIRNYRFLARSRTPNYHCPARSRTPSCRSLARNQNPSCRSLARNQNPSCRIAQSCRRTRTMRIGSLGLPPRLREVR